MSLTEAAFGRTNEQFPKIWLSLQVPRPPHKPGWAQELAESAEASGCVLDLGTQPGLWGGLIRSAAAPLAAFGTYQIERATDSKHAVDLVQAHLIETLCCLGREQVDVYFLRIRRAIEEFQLGGALEALELARQEGHVRFLGLSCEGPGLAALGMWQFNDAFEVVTMPRNPVETEPYETLAPLARERRVGIVTSRPLNWGSGVPFTAIAGVGSELATAAISRYAAEHPVLVGVRTPQEILAAVSAAAQPAPLGIDETLNALAEAYRTQSWSAG